MRLGLPLMILCLFQSLGTVALAADTQGKSLSNYRTEAKYSVASACEQAGGTVIHTTGTPSCRLPTVTDRTPSANASNGHALPLSTKH